MRRYLKRMAVILLCMMTAVTSMGGAAVYAEDSSQSYRFDLVAGNGGSVRSVDTGENLEVSVSVTRTDGTTAGTFTMYGIQYDLLFDTRYFTLDESSLNSGETKGVQLFTSDMSKNGSWKGYKKITAAAVNASGEQWRNGSILLKCTLTAVNSGETELVPYNSIVSVRGGTDTYKSEAEGVKVTVRSADDGNSDNSDNDGNAGGSDSDTGSSGDNSGGNSASAGGGSSSSGGSQGAGNASAPEQNGNEAEGALSKFTDMNAHWSREYVEYAVSRGYFSGMTETTFAPDRTMTRAMLITVLWRMENEPQYSVNSVYKDVRAGIWYENAVQWAAEKKIVNGTGDGRFMPDDAVTREQLMQIIRNYAEYKGINVSASAELKAFNDSSTISSWAEDAFKWGVATGMISGAGKNSLSPKDSATRAQVAKILTEFDKNIMMRA